MHLGIRSVAIAALMAPPGGMMTDAELEQRVLKLSTALSGVLGGFALMVGLVTGSMSILFDGLFSIIDVSMGILGVWMARLVTREATKRFQYGFWHIEPMSLAFYGGMLMVLCLYGFVDAISALLDGGRVVDLGPAIAYTVVMTAACLAMYLYERRTNRAANSQFLHLDAQGWLMSALGTAALLVAFVVAWGLGFTSFAHLAPYADPGILAILCAVLLPIPIRTVRQALTEILLMTPDTLDEQVNQVMEVVVARHGFSGYTSYAAKVGRGAFIEIHILVPPDWQFGSVAEVDAIREEIAAALGNEHEHTWLTVDFTAQESWT
jgi:cation diffusion facilitator family transporter